MDSTAFDALARAIRQVRPRRALLPILGGLLATAEFSPRLADAKKKKKKKLLKSGATPGACSSPPPPPPPPTGCTPTCAGKPCGADDGRGNACGCEAGSLCDEGACRACTVTCNGSGAACGAALIGALSAGGTIYACPGRYVGNFLVTKGITLVGAGQGGDPASNTILDADESDGVMIIEPDITVDLRSLRITGGKDPSGGGGLFNTGVTTITGCTIAKNSAGAGDGGGIYNNGSGPLTLNACTISENSAMGNGGGIRHFGSNSVTLNNCLVSGNQSDAAGAGIATARGAIIIIGAEISGNICQNSGGGVNVSGGTVTFDSASRIVNNTSINGMGGGIRRALTGVVNLNEVTMSGNEPENCDDVPGCVNV